MPNRFWGPNCFRELAGSKDPPMPMSFLKIPPLVFLHFDFWLNTLSTCDLRRPIKLRNSSSSAQKWPVSITPFASSPVRSFFVRDDLPQASRVHVWSAWYGEIYSVLKISSSTISYVLPSGQVQRSLKSMEISCWLHWGKAQYQGSLYLVLRYAFDIMLEGNVVFGTIVFCCVFRSTFRSTFQLLLSVIL